MLAGVGEGVREKEDERVGGSGRESNAAGLEGRGVQGVCGSGCEYVHLAKVPYLSLGAVVPVPSVMLSLPSPSLNRYF